MSAASGPTVLALERGLFEDLSGVDRAFAERVYGGDLARYQERLALIGFDRHDRILDAGCGFGQWSLAMAASANEVLALDHDQKGPRLLRRVADHNGIGHVEGLVGSTEALPVADGSVDAVFSYSVVYFTDWRRSLEEFHRVLRPGGRLYLNTNAIGWFLYLLVSGRNASEGYAPRRYAWRSIRNTLIGRRSGFSLIEGARVTPIRSVLRALEATGFRVVAHGPDGTVDLSGAGRSRPFFKGRRFGLPATFEVVAERSP